MVFLVVLRSLYWFPVCQRTEFKTLQWVHKALKRSFGTGWASVPRIKTKNGKTAFSFYPLLIWNKLPEDFRSAAI